MTKTYLGRKIIKEHIFDKKGTFESWYSACEWAVDNGFSTGSMDGSNPIAMWRGKCSISKWHNLNKSERNDCDAVMIGEFREGPTMILIFNPEPVQI